MTVEQFAHVSYDLIPPHMRDSLRGYIERGWPIGGFLSAVLANDLVHAYGHADEINAAAMRDWASWLWLECPSPAWGSPERVREWQQRRRRHHEATRAAGTSRPCADCDSGAENIPPHDCTKYARREA